MKLLLSSLPSLILIFTVGQAYAEITIVPAAGSGAPGCEETADGCYLPNSVNVEVGESVIFKNTYVAAHTFTSGHPDAGPDGVLIQVY